MIAYSAAGEVIIFWENAGMVEIKALPCYYPVNRFPENRKGFKQQQKQPEDQIGLAKNAITKSFTGGNCSELS